VWKKEGLTEWAGNSKKMNLILAPLKRKPTRNDQRKKFGRGSVHKKNVRNQRFLGRTGRERRARIGKAGGRESQGEEGVPFADNPGEGS